MRVFVYVYRSDKEKNEGSIYRVYKSSMTGGDNGSYRFRIRSTRNMINGWCRDNPFTERVKKSPTLTKLIYKCVNLFSNCENRLTDMSCQIIFKLTRLDSNPPLEEKE